MDWLIVLGLLWLACMIAMVPIMWGRSGRWLGYFMSPQRAADWPPETALEVLDRRYASGEIDQATYEGMRAHLESPAADK